MLFFSFLFSLSCVRLFAVVAVVVVVVLLFLLLCTLLYSFFFFILASFLFGCTLLLPLGCCRRRLLRIFASCVVCKLLYGFLLVSVFSLSLSLFPLHCVAYVCYILLFFGLKYKSILADLIVVVVVVVPFSVWRLIFPQPNVRIPRLSMLFLFACLCMNHLNMRRKKKKKTHKEKTNVGRFFFLYFRCAVVSLNQEYTTIIINARLNMRPEMCKSVCGCACVCVCVSLCAGAVKSAFMRFILPFFSQFKRFSTTA